MEYSHFLYLQNLLHNSNGQFKVPKEVPLYNALFQIAILDVFAITVIVCMFHNCCKSNGNELCSKSEHLRRGSDAPSQIKIPCHICTNNYKTAEMKFIGFIV